VHALSRVWIDGATQLFAHAHDLARDLMKITRRPRHLLSLREGGVVDLCITHGISSFDTIGGLHR
jgi:hypothetical protein